MVRVICKAANLPPKVNASLINWTNSQGISRNMKMIRINNCSSIVLLNLILLGNLWKWRWRPLKDRIIVVVKHSLWEIHVCPLNLTHQWGAEGLNSYINIMRLRNCKQKFLGNKEKKKSWKNVRSNPIKRRLQLSQNPSLPDLDLVVMI